MKKLFWFFIISVLVLVVSLVFTNWQTIWKTIINFPLDLIVAYLFGAVCMFIAGLLSGDKVFRKKQKQKQSQKQN